MKSWLCAPSETQNGTAPEMTIRQADENAKRVPVPVSGASFEGVRIGGFMPPPSPIVRSASAPQKARRR
jgi:hypothetical protein